MLNLWRRHLKSCPHTSTHFRRCKCPVWVMGTYQGQFIRKSLNTNSWERGTAIIREWEETTAEAYDVERAGERFLEDGKSRHLSVDTLNKYRLMFREMQEFFGKKELKHITVDDLSSYRSSWEMAPITSLKKLERLKAFLGFCKARGWVKENRALFLKTGKVDFKPTMPFTDREWEKILWATEVYPNKGIYSFKSGERVRAFVMLLRYTGLRIRDVVRLRFFKDIIPPKDESPWMVFLYTQKTGAAVKVPIPKEVGDLVEWVNMRQDCPEYVFWSGLGNIKSAVGDWQRTLRKLFKIAGVHGHPHMFRATLAVNLLNQGVSLENVATILGNSLKVAEKHYAPFVKSRQENIEAQIRKIWS